MRTLQQKEQAWQKEKEKLLRLITLNKEKKFFLKQILPSISTSKILIGLLFLNCSIIQIFTGYCTVKSMQIAQALCIQPNFEPLVALIGAVVGQTIGYAIYSLKAMKENTKGGIVFQHSQAVDKQMQNYLQAEENSERG